MATPQQNRGCSEWIVDNLGAIILVLVISGFLVAISWPPPGDGFQRKAKCARVASDFRTMATAMGAYFVDEGDYPIMPVEFDTATTKSLAPLRQGIIALSTPIAYITTALIYDPFHPWREARDESYSSAYHYYCPGKCWMLWSLGPDGEFTLTPKALVELRDKKRDVFLPRIHEFAYDPTNGTISAGDIIWLEDRTQSGIPGHKSYQRK